jgi:lipopolysaccharide transport system ATP-binding protein
MQNDTVIKLDKVSKVFSKNYKSARHQLKNIFKESFVGCAEKSTLQEDEFWALKNISFSVEKNEKVAILGPNGSGKSTLLKMLNGIYLPNKGEIIIDGNISSVLELSSGFKPDLSGYENIYLKFALLGKKREEVDEIIDDVIAFSELEDFMETPLKHYSSGMKSKLGFAIVTTITPEILILDEVFAAGDKKFRAKSEARIKELYQNTTTILVTHSMSIVKDVADRVIVLKKGEKVFDGDVTDGISYYNELMH